jgi:hypothetical protein
MLHHVEGCDDSDSGIAERRQIGERIGFLRGQPLLPATEDRSRIGIDSSDLRSQLRGRFEPLAPPTTEVQPGSPRQSGEQRFEIVDVDLEFADGFRLRTAEAVLQSELERVWQRGFPRTGGGVCVGCQLTVNPGGIVVSVVIEVDVTPSSPPPSTKPPSSASPGLEEASGRPAVRLVN